MKSNRKPVIAGNWKMNMTPSQAKTLVEEIKTLTADDNHCDIIVCVPAIDIPAAVEAAKGSNVKVGAQNVHWAKSGAFTAEISADMLIECGVDYAIIGHSERRQYFGETNDSVNSRVLNALEAGLKVILCVGETEKERLDDITSEIVGLQTKVALKGVSAEQMKNVIIAYEPVWAIGTGRTATKEQADEVCGIIRSIIAKLYGNDVSDAAIIQYGGSMNAKNAKELLEMENIDGGLIGGASLKSPDFKVIIDSAK